MIIHFRYTVSIGYSHRIYKHILHLVTLNKAIKESSNVYKRKGFCNKIVTCCL